MNLPNVPRSLWLLAGENERDSFLLVQSLRTFTKGVEEAPGAHAPNVPTRLCGVTSKLRLVL